MNTTFMGYPYGDLAELFAAFRAKGVTEVTEMIRLVEDVDSTAMDYRVQALAAEAKLNRIKTFLKD